MRKAFSVFAAMLALLCSSAQAADDWFGDDKAKHFALSAGIAAATTAYTKDELIGFGVAAAFGVAKEIYDSKHSNRHSASGMDLVADLAGAYVGAKLGGFIFIPQKGGMTLMFVKQLP